MKFKDIEGLLSEHSVDHLINRGNDYMKLGELELEIDVEKVQEILGNHKYWCPSKKEQWGRLAQAIAKECPIKLKEVI